MTQSPRKIRYAVVGVGNIAQVAVLPSFVNARENSELVAIVSSDQEKRAALKAKYGLKHAASYENMEDLLGEADVDAVYLALPNHLHRPFAERAARAGVHVLCEKPMAPSVADCEAMIRAAEEHDVRLMIAYRLHFEAANLGAIELVRAGRIGDPVLFSAFLTQQVREGDIRTRAEVAGGALLDSGIYCINAARYIFGAEPEEVFAFVEEDPDERFHGVDATSLSLLRFSGGRLAQLGTSQAVAKVSSFRVLGTRGDLQVDPAFSYGVERTHHLTLDGETSTRTFPDQDQFAPQLVYFSRCILDGTTPEPSGWEGLADLRIIEALRESGRTGRPVRLEPFTRHQRPSAEQLITRPAITPPEPINAPAPAQG